ncbi:MAG: glycosyltransferase family 2 protein [Firmicutes bacterium]|nr:glycosyltransferase family 2 protein [Bacillota bacterium]
MAAPSPRPTVSANYIVLNEEEFLPYSIRSIYNVVDEIVVVDNGSTDRTLEVARSFAKVRIYHSDARDFSALRNLALSHCRGDWVMVMCADEVFYRDVEEVVPRLVRDPEVDAYTCRYYHLMRSYYYMQNCCDHDERYRRIFLFRRRPGVRYERPVHQVLVGIGPHVRDSGLYYVHYGYTKDPVLILERWKLYAELEGNPGIYDQLDPQHILDDRPLHPFRRPHPEVIRDYIEKKAAERAARGEKLFRKPPPDPEGDGSCM